MSSYANPAAPAASPTAAKPITKPAAFQTSSGLNFSEGIQNLTALGNRYKDNPTVSGLVIGGLADAYKTQVNMGLAGLYNDTFLASQANYQRGLEDKRKGDTLEIMAAEIAGARGLQKGQVEGAINLQAEQNRGSMYVADQGLKGIESQTGAQRYVADRSLEGTRYGFDSQERQIGLTGSEERKTLGAKADQELRLRADARGAIRSQGARFYG